MVEISVKVHSSHLLVYDHVKPVGSLVSASLCMIPSFIDHIDNLVVLDVSIIVGNTIFDIYLFSGALPVYHVLEMLFYASRFCVIVETDEDGLVASAAKARGLGPDLEWSKAWGLRRLTCPDKGGMGLPLP